MDFDNSKLVNSATISFKSLIDNLDKVILDQAYMKIVSVKDDAGATLTYEVKAPSPDLHIAESLGAPLTITLPKKYNKD